jgi:hypothetical protein
LHPRKTKPPEASCHEEKKKMPERGFAPDQGGTISLPIEGQKAAAFLAAE